jgi:hypothetical protein
MTLGGKPSPSSVMRMMIRRAVHSPSIQTVERAKSTAFCTRLRKPWMISGRRRIVGCGSAVLDRGEGEVHPLAARQMRLGRLAQHRRQGGLPQMQVVLSGPAHVAQDVAAAVGLFADQAGIFLQLGLARPTRRSARR